MKLIYEGVQMNEHECLDRVAFEVGDSGADTITITLRRIPASDRVPEHWAVRATAGEGNIEEDPPCPAEDDGPIMDKPGSPDHPPIPYPTFPWYDQRQYYPPQQPWEGGMMPWDPYARPMWLYDPPSHATWCLS